ncbi:MAG: hypothetical protein ABG776_03950, partial [Cyanobacteria bacterium J06555_13]
RGHSKNSLVVFFGHTRSCHPPADQRSILGCSEAKLHTLHQQSRKWLKEKKAISSLARRKESPRADSGLLEHSKELEVSPGAKLPHLHNRCHRIKPGEKSIGIEGARESIETVICFLEELPRPVEKDAKLYIMVNGRTATIERFADDLLPRWYEAMKSALEKGWSVVHIVRLDEDLERIQKLVRGILLLVGQEGKYEPLAFKQKYVMPVAESFLLVPSLHKGMIFYSSQNPRYVGSAIYIEDEIQIDILTRHFKLLQAETNPIFRLWNNYADVVSYLKQADLAPGKRIVILKRLSDIQRPKHWYSEDTPWAKAHQIERDLDIDELRQCLLDRKFRRRSLEENSLTHSSRYIYTNKCIDLYFKEGKEVSLPNYSITAKDRLEQLAAFKQLLHYPHYEMAMTEEDMYKNLDVSDNLIEKAEFPDIIPDFCEVQENHLVLLHFPIKQSAGQLTKSKWIVIEEPVIVKAFYQYIADIWEKRIPAPRKDKFQIHRWLEEQEKALAN